MTRSLKSSQTNRLVIHDFFQMLDEYKVCRRCQDEVGRGIEAARARQGAVDYEDDIAVVYQNVRPGLNR